MGGISASSRGGTSHLRHVPPTRWGLNFSSPFLLHSTQPRSKAIAFASEAEKMSAPCKKKRKKKDERFFPLHQEVFLGDPACPKHSIFFIRQQRLLKLPESWPGLCKSVTTSSQVANNRTRKLQELFELSSCDGRLACTCLFLFLHLRVCVQYRKITCYIKLVV